MTTSMSRMADATVCTAINPASYSTACRSEDGLVYLQRVAPPPVERRRIAPAKRGVSLSLFPATQAGLRLEDAGFAPDPVGDEIRLRSVFECERGREAGVVLSFASELTRLIALSHALRCWVEWSESTAAAFHYGMTPGQAKRNEAKARKAFSIFLIASVMRLETKKNVFGLVGSMEHLPGQWVLGPPQYLMNSGVERDIRIQPRYSGALGRFPRNGAHDQTGFIYHIAEAILHSGRIVRGVPELIASGEGVKIAVVDLFELAGLMLPADKAERKKRLQWFDRRIDSIVSSRGDRPETVHFERVASVGEQGRAVRIKATSAYRDLYLTKRKHELVVGVEDLLPGL